MLKIEQKVLETIDIEGMLSYLSSLMAIRSLTGTKIEDTAQEHIATQMKHCGLDLDIWPLNFTRLKQHPAFCVEVERNHGLGVVGSMGQDNGGQHLILNGHVDVVPIGNKSNWQYPPWQATITNKRVYGRGSVDMKGGLCCALFAAKAIHDADINLKGKLIIQSVIGEEDGGVGTLATILRGYKANGAIIMEPTQLKIAPAQAGALNFRITIPGQAAHGCLRNEGISAIEKFPPLYQALMKLEKEINQENTNPLFANYPLPYPLCVGTIQGGTWASTVTESLTFEGRYGIPVGANIAQARRRFEETIAKAAHADTWLKTHPPTLNWWGGQFEPASIPTNHPIVQTVSSAFKHITKTPAQLEGMPYGADMRLLVNIGQTPTVMFGPGNVRQAHRPDEFVPIDELVTATRTLALTILRFCEYKL